MIPSSSRIYLDPDSARAQADNDTDQPREEGLTLANLAWRYLEEDYPYRHTDIHEYRSIEALADILAHDALLIYRLAVELPGRMSKELLQPVQASGAAFDGCAGQHAACGYWSRR